ncbi:FAD-dependent monooxygenase [Caenimonas terrae]|uniref:FAD-dependent monooxygenase n=1 Tax=Caenimonas terrae TaxID=696074 RepID=A0ABW0NIE7_9BURK
MSKQVLIAGAGMGGLAAAIASARAGWHPRVFEQADGFGEAGAGIQLGPNATRVLEAWGLGTALARVAAFPQRLAVRSAGNGEVLAQLMLGPALLERYGAPYATLHRADLHRVLLDGAADAGAELLVQARIERVREAPDAVLVSLGGPTEIEGDALVGADGLWSRVRQEIWADGPPVSTGHLAYRTLVAQQDLPKSLRSDEVTVWLGPRLHVVTYPVRGGDWLNVVAIVQGALTAEPEAWDQAAAAGDLQQALGATCAALQELVQAAPDWLLWVLHERPPLKGAQAMSHGRVALLGDAAHPMRPYLAQGAGMAIEDAQELGRCLAMARDRIADPATALRRYALNRWERCARVQRQAERNGRIFHATGPVQWGRDLSLRLLGERLLDQPWLYR